MSKDTSEPNLPAIILAAGASKRMGYPKQLLDFQGKTFLQHAIDTVHAASFTPIIVVLGAFYETIFPTLSTYKDRIHILHNPKWETGMGGSLQIGASFLLQNYPDSKGILCVLCDQPLIDSSHLRKLFTDWYDQKGLIIATQYSGTKGVPVVFDQQYLTQLAELTGAVGARHLIIQNEKDVWAINYETAARDIDTPDAYDRLKQEFDYK